MELTWLYIPLRKVVVNPFVSRYLLAAPLLARAAAGFAFALVFFGGGFGLGFWLLSSLVAPVGLVG